MQTNAEIIEQERNLRFHSIEIRESEIRYDNFGIEYQKSIRTARPATAKCDKG
jgi:hypothetical protein